MTEALDHPALPGQTPDPDESVRAPIRRWTEQYSAVSGLLEEPHPCPSL